MTNQTDIKEILENEFESRSARNAHYSLRAFARDLGLSPASLSLILSGKQGVSRKTAAKIGERLGMTAKEKSYFCDLAESRHARSELQQSLARIRLRQHKMESSNLQVDAFKVISDWYHFAILELTELKEFQSSPRWIARALGISEKVAQSATGRLLRLGLLEETPQGLRQTHNFLAVPSGPPSDSIKKFHQQILEKALQALAFQSVDERDFSTVIVPVSRADLPQAREWIKDFRRQFVAKLESSPRKDSVYSLGIQFFRLSQREAQPTKVSHETNQP